MSYWSVLKGLNSCIKTSIFNSTFLKASRKRYDDAHGKNLALLSFSDIHVSLLYAEYWSLRRRHIEWYNWGNCSNRVLRSLRASSFRETYETLWDFIWPILESNEKGPKYTSYIWRCLVTGLRFDRSFQNTAVGQDLWRGHKSICAGGQQNTYCYTTCDFNQALRIEFV